MDATPLKFTMQQAADRCGVDKSTISRKRKSGKFPNARQEADGTWRIPLADLLADGLAPAPATDRTALQLQMNQLQHRAELAELQLAERDKTIERLEREIVRLGSLFDKFDLLVNRAIEAPALETTIDLRNAQPVKKRWFRRNQTV
jgi:transcriptional regulator with XRE-family HTH domain